MDQELIFFGSPDMERTFVVDCKKKVGEKVKLSGWVQTVRVHGKVAFFDLRDWSGTMQVVGSEKIAEEIGLLNQQDVVEVIGVVKEREKRFVNPQQPLGSIELGTESLAVLSKAASMPFDMGGKDLDLELPTLLDHRSLALRHQKVRDIFEVQAKVLEGFRKAVEKLGCKEIVVPTIAASSTEGGSEVFTIDYFDYKAYLTQSPQLYKQMMVPVFERVWTIAHAYRAEPSVTTRHLTETTQLDCEFGFVEFIGLLDIFEEVAVSMLKHAEEQCSPLLKKRSIPQIAFGKIPRLKLMKAQEIIEKEFGRNVRGEKDLSPQDEVDICKWVLKNRGSDLVTITHFPTAKRAFYTMPDPENPEVSLSYDMLFRGVEIMSGSQRVHEYKALVNILKERGMDPKQFAMYLMAFQYGMPPEGGFSFGLERITMKLLQLGNVREASLYPRDMERVDERLSTIDKQK